VGELIDQSKSISRTDARLRQRLEPADGLVESTFLRLPPGNCPAIPLFGAFEAGAVPRSPKQDSESH